MTEEQKKRRDELADRYRHKTNETEITITGTFKAGYEAGYADAKEEILKLKTALGVAGEFIKRNDELTRKLEVAKKIAKEAIKRIDCLPTCRSNSDSWLVKCSCGADKKAKELREALNGLE